MSKHVILSFIGICALSAGSSAHATMGSRTGLIEEIQLESANRVGYQDIVWLRLTGAWGSASCTVNIGYFNAKDNPQFMATALAAYAMGQTLKIFVDDTYAKKDGYCQIINITTA